MCLKYKASFETAGRRNPNNPAERPEEMIA
jgi:hypothetical protein